MKKSELDALKAKNDAGIARFVEGLAREQAQLDAMLRALEAEEERLYRLAFGPLEAKHRRTRVGQIARLLAAGDDAELERELAKGAPTVAEWHAIVELYHGKALVRELAAKYAEARKTVADAGRENAPRGGKAFAKTFEDEKKAAWNSAAEWRKSEPHLPTNKLAMLIRPGDSARHLRTYEDWIREGEDGGVIPKRKSRGRPSPRKGPPPK